MACERFPLGLRSRPMLEKDVAECAEIVAGHPIIGPRYGEMIKYLRPAWLRLLGSEAFVTAVFEDSDGGRIKIWGVGVSVFVDDDFMRAVKTPPLCWYGPEVAKRIAEGDSPVLSDKQVRTANSGKGLNALAWEGCLRQAFAKRPDAYHLVMGSFIELHRGYRWNEVISPQVESGERLRWTTEAGGWLWNPDEARYVKWTGKDASHIAENPHIIGITRDLELDRFGTWVGALFDYHPPRMSFSSCEQRLLRASLPGTTDEELADELAISLATVKNMWRSIYNRAASCVPELFTDDRQADLPISGRGKEKRRRLLSYLRDHPEELRPISRRRLQSSS